VLADSLEHLAPWMPWAAPDAVTPAAQREHLEAAVRNWEAGTDYEFALAHPNDGALLGCADCTDGSGPAPSSWATGWHAMRLATAT